MSQPPLSPDELARAALAHIQSGAGQASPDLHDYLTNLFLAERRAAYERAAGVVEEIKTPYTSPEEDYLLERAAARIRELKGETP